jgi:hypothetical protein
VHLGVEAVAAAGRYPNRVHAAASTGLPQQPERPGAGDRLGGGPLI